MKKLILLFICVACLGSACTKQAQDTEYKQTVTPYVACDYLTSQGFITGNYQSDGMGGFFCTTPYKMIDSLSSITYSINGQANNAENLILTLNYHNSTNESVANSLFLENAKILTQKALNAELSDNMIKNIQNKTNITENYNSSTVEFTKENYATNKGYNMSFIIKL